MTRADGARVGGVYAHGRFSRSLRTVVILFGPDLRPSKATEVAKLPSVSPAASNPTLDVVGSATRHYRHGTSRRSEGAFPVVAHAANAAKPRTAAEPIAMIRVCR
jgi:hypothetical protein